MAVLKINPEPRPFLQLFKMAGAEVGIDYHIEPDWDEYKELIATGKYLFIGAYSGELPVGYIGIFYCTSLFNRLVTSAIVDSFYVLPEFRKGTIAGRLIQTAEPIVRAQTNRMVFQCEPSNPLAKMIERRGFKAIDCTYEKVWK